MNTYLLGIRGAIASGSEPTFDGQPMQPGIHLRWGFAPELGFPPYGFQLCRKEAGQGERHITPPQHIWITGSSTPAQASHTQVGQSTQGGASSQSGPSGTSSQGGTSASSHQNGEGGQKGQHQHHAGDANSHSHSPLPWQPGRCEWHARLPETCHHVSVTGVADEGVEEVILETYTHVTSAKVVLTGRHCAQVENQCFTTTVRATAITVVRVLGASEIQDCDCGIINPPQGASNGEDDDEDEECEDEKDRDSDDDDEDEDCGNDGGGTGGTGGTGGGGGTGGTGGTGGGTGGGGTGGTGGGGTGGGTGGTGSGSGTPVWGQPGKDGWQCLSTVFTLPITDANWPSHYAGAPSPFAPDVVDRDVDECIRRLNGLKLDINMDQPTMRDQLKQLRESLRKLVHGFPTPLLYDVPIDQAQEDGANAPILSMNLMQQLLLVSLNPYMARVLGLYFVDTDIQVGTVYDYYLVGLWGKTPCATRKVSLGAAPVTQLAQGNALNDGVTISAFPAHSTSRLSNLIRWTNASGPLEYVVQLRILWGPLQEVPVLFDIVVAGTTTSKVLVIETKVPTPGQVCRLTLKRPVAQADIQVASAGRVLAQHNGTTIAVQEFNALSLTTITLSSPSPADQPIDELIIEAYGSTVIVGELVLHLLAPGGIGEPYTVCHVDSPMVQLTAPAQPVTISRRRQAEIDTKSSALVPLSNLEVQWAAPPSSTISGTPTDPPLNVPLPNQPIGYRAMHIDSGSGNIALLPRIIAAMSQDTPADSPLAKTTPPAQRIIRFVNAAVPDPAGGWIYRVAAFDAFGALGQWSASSAPFFVQPIAASPTRLDILRFDNSPASGGAEAADGLAWVGATLKVQVAWSGAALVMYPDTVSARITVEELDGSNPPPVLLTNDITLPPHQVIALQVQSITNISPEVASIQMVTQLPATSVVGLPLQGSDPTPLLILVGLSRSGTPIVEQYVVRPVASANYQQSHSVTATIQISSVSRISTNKNAFVSQSAYLVLGYSPPPLTLALPTFSVPIGQRTARGQVYVDASPVTPFAAGNTTRSREVAFAGQQWLTPPVPFVPAPPIPTHIVHHDYYDPADFYGRATRQLPLQADPSLQGANGFVLLRAPMQALFQADLQRRQANNGSGLIDMGFSIREADGTTRGDLQLWDALLTAWRDAYNIRTFGQNTSQWLDASKILNDSKARRAFIEHFYGGLLDDELRVLADNAANAQGFARVNGPPIVTKTPTLLRDTVDGSGFGRVVYKLAAVNAAGSTSPSSHAVGPYYTRIITPSRPPVLYKITPQNGSLALEWVLDNNPDSGAYFIYRTDDPGQLSADQTQFADLRYFGSDRAHPMALTALKPLVYRPQQWPPLVFDTSDPAKLSDPRLVALVPDLRLFARDYSDGDYSGVHFNGSDMGEIVLPAGVLPEHILAVYRLSEYNPALAPEPSAQAQAFNYWQPGQGGTAQLVKDSATQVRLIGLRIGLGRGVPVVVVGIINGATQVFGALPTLSSTQTPVRRYTFVDGAVGAGNDGVQRFDTTPLTAGTLYYYSIVAVDIFGNRSTPSRVFAAQTLGLPVAAHP